MDKTEVHKMLTQLPDDQKMKLAIECQLNGVTVEQLEETLARILSGVEACVTPVLKEYRYLCGGSDQERYRR